MLQQGVFKAVPARPGCRQSPGAASRQCPMPPKAPTTKAKLDSGAVWEQRGCSRGGPADEQKDIYISHV